MKAIWAALLGLLVVKGSKGSNRSETPETSTDKAKVLGIDVSKWQGSHIDYAAVKGAGNAFVFIKGTEGNTLVDPNFAHNFKAAKAAGLLVGAYHFYITGDSPEQQFDNFKKAVALGAGDLPPVVDIETLKGGSAAQVPENLQKFLDLLQSEYGVQPIIYAGESFADTHLSGFGSYPLWLAEYNDADKPRMPKGWKTWAFWQYSQSGRVPGIDGDVDMNRFNGALDQLERYLIK